MRQDATTRHGLDLGRIDIADDYELRAWADKLGVDKERIREAVKAVGDDATAVEHYLDRQRQTPRWINFADRIENEPKSPERGFELALFYAVTGDESKGRERRT